MTRRPPTSTCATCRTEHACTLFSVLCHNHLSHPHWLKSSLSPSFHPHGIHVWLSLILFDPLLLLPPRTSSSFSCPSSPCTPTTLTPVTNNLCDSAKGSNDVAFLLTGYEPNDMELKYGTGLNELGPQQVPRLPGFPRPLYSVIGPRHG